MKLCRIGDLGFEKPALIDSENNYRDLSSVIKDLDSSTSSKKSSARKASSTTKTGRLRASKVRVIKTK